MQALSHSRVTTCMEKDRFALDILHACYSEGQLKEANAASAPKNPARVGQAP